MRKMNAGLYLFVALPLCSQDYGSNPTQTWIQYARCVLALPDNKTCFVKDKGILWRNQHETPYLLLTDWILCAKKLGRISRRLGIGSMNEK